MEKLTYKVYKKDFKSFIKFLKKKKTYNEKIEDYYDFYEQSKFLLLHVEKNNITHCESATRKPEFKNHINKTTCNYCTHAHGSVSCDYIDFTNYLRKKKLKKITYDSKN